MRFTQKHNDLIYGALGIFLEDDLPDIVSREPDSIHFVTVLGRHGDIVKNMDNNWDILIDKNIVYTIESEIFAIIKQQENAPEINDFAKSLEELAMSQKILQDKSKILLNILIKGVAKVLIEKNTIMSQYNNNKFLLN